MCTSHRLHGRLHSPAGVSCGVCVNVGPSEDIYLPYTGASWSINDQWTLSADQGRPVPLGAVIDKPNILVIMPDDLGYWNFRAYNRGVMGYRTPNIDRIAKEGALFTDQYAQPSCTPGRASTVRWRNSTTRPGSRRSSQRSSDNCDGRPHAETDRCERRSHVPDPATADGRSRSSESPDLRKYIPFL
jgi:hypothetical protein